MREEATAPPASPASLQDRVFSAPSRTLHRWPQAGPPAVDTEPERPALRAGSVVCPAAVPAVLVAWTTGYDVARWSVRLVHATPFPPTSARSEAASVTRAAIPWSAGSVTRVGASNI